MKNPVFITICLVFLGCFMSNAQDLSKRDSIFEREIHRIVSNRFNATCMDYEQSFSFLFVINYDSISKDSIRVSVDTFFGGNYSMDDRANLYKSANKDAAKYRSIISRYHPSKSLSVIVPYFLYPDSFITKGSCIFDGKGITGLMLQYVDKLKKYYAKNKELCFTKPYVFEYGPPVH